MTCRLPVPFGSRLEELFPFRLRDMHHFVFLFHLWEQKPAAHNPLPSPDNSILFVGPSVSKLGLSIAWPEHPMSSSQNLIKLRHPGEWAPSPAQPCSQITPDPPVCCTWGLLHIPRDCGEDPLLRKRSEGYHCSGDQMQS